MGIVITEFSERHLDALTAIERRCFSDPWSRAMLAAELEKDYSMYLIAEKDGVPAGYVGAHLVADEASINNVATDPDFRREGIAELLITELIRRASERGAVSFNLEVRENNTPAISLYKKMGFLPVGVRKNYYSNPTENALIMIKEL